MPRSGTACPCQGCYLKLKGKNVSKSLWSVMDALPLPIEMALFAPSGVCILAASYFFFRGLKRKETT
jgi:hypothetical protein